MASASPNYKHTNSELRSSSLQQNYRHSKTTDTASNKHGLSAIRTLELSLLGEASDEDMLGTKVNTALGEGDAEAKGGEDATAESADKCFTKIIQRHLKILFTYT